LKSRTELQCVVDDLQATAARSNGTLDDLRNELIKLEDQIAVKEAELERITPDWDALRTREADEKRALDDVRGRLSVLFAKQGRLSRFKTRAERDRFLNSEIASLKQFHGQQKTACDGMRVELETTKHSLEEIGARKERMGVEADAGRERVRKLGEEVAKIKDEHAEMTERRKGLWREDTKLDSLVGRAKEELSAAERALAGMMDKVSHIPCL
jgi:structural maintenance of chromosome 3 (chondroitin sulfate proteoglycan 6)